MVLVRSILYLKMEAALYIFLLTGTLIVILLSIFFRDPPTLIKKK